MTNGMFILKSIILTNLANEVNVALRDRFYPFLMQEENFIRKIENIPVRFDRKVDFHLNFNLIACYNEKGQNCLKLSVSFNYDETFEKKFVGDKFFYPSIDYYLAFTDDELTELEESEDTSETDMEIFKRFMNFAEKSLEDFFMKSYNIPIIF